MGDSGAIDYVGLAAALLDRAHILVPQWLPGGRTIGHEYVCGGLDGGDGRSLSVNLITGKWADFAGDDDDRGGDLLSLYARIHGLTQAQAARQLMRDLGWQRSTVQTSAQGAAPADARPQPPAEEGTDAPAAAAATGERKRSIWQPVVPVPAYAPPPRFRHGYKDERGAWVDMEYACHWEYRLDGELYGYVARFHRTTSGGEVKKETVPFTWCIDTSDDRRQQRWHTKGWDDPRPLYVPATVLAADPALVPVVIVEGEKCAKAGHDLLPAEFDFVTWPGGAPNWAKGDWPRLRGRVVYLWADCDAKRARLTKAEREAGMDPGTKPLLPAARQPGVRAMVGIGSRLAADLGCTVLWCPIPAPGDAPDGWDIADAIASGWDAVRVRDFIRSAQPFVPPDDAARAKGTTDAKMRARALAGADPVDDPQAWRSALLTTPKGAILSVRDNIVIALHGVPSSGIAGVPEAAGLIAYNEFSNNVEKRRATPWNTPAGPWDEADELLMGEWLTREYWLPSMPRGTLEEAVLMVARKQPFHPVRERFQALRGRWDGEKRLGTWLRRVCLEEDEYDDKDPLQRYLARVGTWVLMAMVARVMRASCDGEDSERTGPGCKFDYMMVLEGPTGWGKSTLASVLGGKYFADTGLQLGEKDSYQNLQGVHVYEWSELDGLSKAENTKVKSFVSSRKDRFRASFDRRPKNYPRQMVFIGTTNETHYLSDPTGNRRFWPVKVTRPADLDWLRDNLDQMFAEAIVYLDAGDRFHPTHVEQRELFDPQQQDRMVDNPIAGKIAAYLHPPKELEGPGMEGLLTDGVTVVDLLGKVGITVDKLGPGRFHERQATAALRALGWTERRSSAPGRPRRWYRPQERISPPTSHDAGSQPSQEAGDDCPF